MKNKILISLLVLAPIILAAQNKDSTKSKSKIKYWNLQFGWGKNIIQSDVYENVIFKSNFILLNNYGFGFVFHSSSIFSKNKPVDYSPGLNLTISGFTPKDICELYSLVAIKNYDLSKKNNNHFTVSVGPSIAKLNILQFTKRSSSGFGIDFGGNYYTSPQETQSIGLYFEAAVDCTFGRKFGLGFKGYANAASNISSIGFACIISIGKLREMKK